MRRHKHEIWTLYKDTPKNKRDFLDRFTPDFYLRPEVPGVVKEAFIIVQTLIEHSFYEYNSYDQAAVKSLLTIELALKLRYKELEGKDWKDNNKNNSLKNLMLWFYDRNYFETYDFENLNKLRELRNRAAHPSYHTISGPIYHRSLIGSIIDLVNGLYENPELRRDRMDITKKLNEHLDSFKCGLKITGMGFSILAYKAWIGFFDNKSISNLIHFYFKPCCLTMYNNVENAPFDASLAFYCLANVVDCQSEQLVFSDNNNNKLFVASIPDNAEQDIYNQFINNYKNNTPATDNDIIMNRYPIDPFLLHLREFHKV